MEDYRLNRDFIRYVAKSRPFQHTKHVEKWSWAAAHLDRPEHLWPGKAPKHGDFTCEWAMFWADLFKVKNYCNLCPLKWQKCDSETYCAYARNMLSRHDDRLRGILEICNRPVKSCLWIPYKGQRIEVPVVCV